MNNQSKAPIHLIMSDLKRFISDFAGKENVRLVEEKNNPYLYIYVKSTNKNYIKRITDEVATAHGVKFEIEQHNESLWFINIDDNQ